MTILVLSFFVLPLFQAFASPDHIPLACQHVHALDLSGSDYIASVRFDETNDLNTAGRGHETVTVRTGPLPTGVQLESATAGQGNLQDSRPL
ncbi:MAG: hypothetical protein C5B49_13240 [Bdellovibrio sp.]|nr:MAG: hypothetical protein C5B49_13240 [Bdellovibrio sp.]